MEAGSWAMEEQVAQEVQVAVESVWMRLSNSSKPLSGAMQRFCMRSFRDTLARLSDSETTRVSQPVTGQRSRVMHTW